MNKLNNQRNNQLNWVLKHHPHSYIHFCGVKTESKEAKANKAVQADQVVKVKSTKAPRFRRTKISGRNLRRHPFGQNKVNPGLGRINSGFQPSRIDDIGPRQVVLRAGLKDLYGVHTSSATRSPIARPYKKWKHSRKNIDRSISVLLHRSGLANSIEHARQLVYHGHIYRKSTTSKDNTKDSLIVRPTYIVPVGSLIYIHKIRGNLAPANALQWSKWQKSEVNKDLNMVNGLGESASPEVKRSIPPYLEVDYVNGAFVLVNDTDINTVLLPAGLGVTRKNILH